MVEASLHSRIAELETEVAQLNGQLRSFREQATNHFRGIADALPVMISYVDRDERFQFANKAYESWFDRALADIIGRRVSALMPSAEYAFRRPYIVRALAGETVTYEAAFPHSTGLRRTVVHHLPQFAGGKVVGFYALVQDVTNQWRAAEIARESEARFRRIADSAPVPIWVTAPNRTREFVNQAYVDFLGVPYDQALLFDWRSILHEEDHDRVIRESLAGEASHSKFVLEARYRRGDGEWRWLRSISQPRFTAEGMPEGFIGVAEDITAAKLAAAQADARAEQLQASIDTRTLERDRLWSLSSDAFAICDAEGVWVSASPAWTTLLGWSQRELVGRTSAWIEHPDDAELMDDARHKLRAGHPLRAFTSRLRGADGKYRRISWSAVPEGERAYCIARDVTGEHERAEAMQAVEEALRQSQKMEAIGQLTGGVAHDFNNLLTPILGTLDLLLRQAPEEDRRRRLIDGAHQSAMRAKNLVHRLLTFARRQPLEPRAIDVWPLVMSMEDLFRSTLGPAIDLLLQADGGVPKALADTNQLEMALLNLVVNARDAMPQGGQITISLSTYSGTQQDEVGPGNFLKLLVEDTGPGMSPETLRRATEPFFSTKPTGAGTGLGLSMVHGLMAQLGGALRIKSALGSGTQVALLLPTTSEVSVEPDLPTPRCVKGNSMSILLVDDEPLVRGNTAALLAELGHKVIDCASPVEALQKLEGSFRPDLLVTDQVMPQMNGVRLIQEARVRLPHLPAIIISGYPEGDLPGLAAGRLAKPFGLADLARAIDTLSSSVSHRPQTVHVTPATSAMIVASD